MQGIARSPSNTCARCLRFRARHGPTKAAAGTARFQSTDATKDVNQALQERQNDTTMKEEKEVGAMSRRLEEMASENLQTGGRSARKAVEESGFSEDWNRKSRLRASGATMRVLLRRLNCRLPLVGRLGISLAHSLGLAPRAWWTLRRGCCKMLTSLCGSGVVVGGDLGFVFRERSILEGRAVRVRLESGWRMRGTRRPTTRR
jgi:hypothetical protein